MDRTPQPVPRDHPQRALSRPWRRLRRHHPHGWPTYDPSYRQRYHSSGLPHLATLIRQNDRFFDFAGTRANPVNWPMQVANSTRILSSIHIRRISSFCVRAVGAIGTLIMNIVSTSRSMLLSGGSPRRPTSTGSTSRPDRQSIGEAEPLSALCA
jgi:hypothetical protein